MNKLAHNKFIPRAYMTGSVEQRLMLLRGLMDTDGTCSLAGAATFSSSSEQLARDVVELVRSLGGVASTYTWPTSYTKDGVRRAGRQCWCVYLRLNHNPFLLERKAARWHTPKKLSRRIITITPAGYEDTRCIAVNTRRNLYVTDDYVVTHNTVQGIRAARALRGRTIVVVPKFLVSVWTTGLEGDKTLDPPTPPGWPGQKVLVLKGTTTVRPSDPGAKVSKAARDSLALAAQLQTLDHPMGVIKSTVDIVIINYDILYAWVDVLLAWEPKTLIFDEAHMLMGDKARRTRAAERLRSAIPNRMMLSATPMTSRPRDLWAPVNVLSEARFGAPFPFFKRYCNAFQERVATDRIVWNTKGSSNLDELHRRLRFFMLRRTKEDVGMQLPPRTRQIIEVEVEKRFQLSMAVALMNDESMRRALDMAADGKLSDVAQLALGHAQDGNKVVIGTWRKAVAEELANALRGADVDARVITGDVNEKKRKEILAAQPPVICATLDSMGMGLDLSFANVGICAELHYVPSKLVQWEGRLHRFRQKRPTLFQYVIATGTADELIRDMVIKKMHTFKDGVGKSSDKLMDDLEGGKKSPTEVLRGLYLRMTAKQAPRPDNTPDDVLD
jgi:superfamily II DNA or RNA helicase